MTGEKIINWHTIIYSDLKYLEKQYNIEMLLNSQEFKEFLDTIKIKSNIVIWWDGTMLFGLKKYFTNKKPFVWINFWNKWFLLQNKKIILEKNNFTQKKYNIYEVYIDGKLYNNFINEISFQASNGKMWNFHISLCEKKHFELSADGFIISTPLWSTAYNSSLWWPILDHDSQVLWLTAKAPWKPRNMNSIIFKDNTEINIKNIGRFHWVEIYCDWHWEKFNDQNIEIQIKKSKIDIQISIADSQLINWENKILEF